MSVEGPGLPAELEDENYWCYIKDSKGRFNFSVPAEQIKGNTLYMCNITERDLEGDGVHTGM